MSQTCSEPLVWTCKSCGHSFHEKEWAKADRKCPACQRDAGNWKCTLCQETFNQPALSAIHPCRRVSPNAAIPPAPITLGGRGSRLLLCLTSLLAFCVIGAFLCYFLSDEKWRKLRLQYPWSKASQLGEILDKVAASFAATDPVIERPKMYFFYDPDLKRIYESEFFDGDEKIGVPPDFGPFVYQPSESSVRISNMNRNRVFGKSFGGVFFDGKVVPGEVYVFQNDFLTGNWRRLSTQEAVWLLRHNGISPPKSLRKPTARQTEESSAETEAPDENPRVS